MAGKLSELQFQRKVIDEFRDQGCWCRYNSPDMDPGRPDLIVCRDDHYLWIELKIDGKPLRPQQNAWAIEFGKINPGRVWLMNYDNADRSTAAQSLTATGASALVQGGSLAAVVWWILYTAFDTPRKGIHAS